MDARNVFSHPNLEQTIRPINIVVDGSDKLQVWARQAGRGRRMGMGAQRSRPVWLGSGTSNNGDGLLHCYKLRASGAQLPASRGREQEEQQGGYCVQRERALLRSRRTL